MTLRLTLAALAGMLVLAAAPTTALAVPPDRSRSDYKPAPPPPPGPKAGLPQQAKAYGRYCQGMSKRHVKGEKGTEFSRCVKAMAKAANTEAAPRKSCRGLSRKHVKGERGTEFSRCVKAAARLRKDQRATA